MAGSSGGPVGARRPHRIGPHPVLAALPALPLIVWVIVFIMVPMGTMAVFSLWRYHNFDLEPVWNLFDLTPQGRPPDWEEQLRY